MGENSANGYFYKPALGASGSTEKGLFDAKLDSTDVIIKANVDARHAESHTAASHSDIASTGANIDDAVTKKHTVRLDWANIISCKDYDHPDDAITAIASTNKTLLVTEAETCDTNFTVPANVTVRFERGGKWTINTSVTVTFNGQIEAGLWQIFAYVGTGTLAGTLNVVEAYPEWWATNTTPGTTNMTTAIQSAINTGKKVRLGETTYLISSSLKFNISNTSMYGDGIKSIIQTSANSAIGIEIASTANATHLEFSNFKLNGTSSNAGGISVGSASYYVAFLTIKHIYIKTFIATNAYGMGITKLQEGDFENVHFGNNYYNIYSNGTGYITTTKFRGYAGRIGTATKDAIYIAGASANHTLIFENQIFESNAYDAISVGDGAAKITLNECYFEANNTSASGDAEIYMVHGHLFMNRCIFFGQSNPYDILNLDGVLANIRNSGGAFDVGKVTTTANSKVHFENNSFYSGENSLAEYKALLGDISVIDRDVALPGYVLGFDLAGAILGDTTSGRVMRRVYVLIQNGTNAATIKATSGNRWNGDTNSAEDNLAKNGDTGVFTLDSTGATFTLQDAGLTGTCIAVLSVEIYSNASGTDLCVNSNQSNGIYMTFSNSTSAVAVDLTTLVDTGDIKLHITYITSE